MCVAFVTRERVCACVAFAISSERRSVCVALVAIAGRRYTYNVCTTYKGGPTRTSADVSMPRLAGFSLIT